MRTSPKEDGTDECRTVEAAGLAKDGALVAG